MMEKIAFYSGGYRLSGNIRIPQSDKKVPGIVCCHGYGGYWDVELLMQDIAERLMQAGYATLTFYHRGLGESEGPKGRIIPQEQADDIRNAITYLQTRKEIEPQKIGLYGTSFGGANVVYAAAMDRRAKCVVSTGGIGNCERWLRSVRRRWEWMEFLKTIEEDRKNRVLTGQSRYVDPAEILMPPPEDVKKHGETRKKYLQKWGIKGYTLENPDAMLDYKPEDVVERISPRPILFIHTDMDAVVPPEESLNMFERAKEPKRILIIEGYAHYDVYKEGNPVLFERVMSTAANWFKEYLKD